MANKKRAAINRNETSPVRRARIPPDLTYETMSEMGRDLFDLSREIESSDEALLSEEELERELIRRRGGYAPDDDQ